MIQNIREKSTIAALMSAHMADIFTTAYVIDVLGGEEVNALPAFLMAEGQTELFWYIKVISMGSLALLYAYTKERNPETFQHFRRSIELLTLISWVPVVWNVTQIAQAVSATSG